jgi:hypothetical protein
LRLPLLLVLAAVSLLVACVVVEFPYLAYALRGAIGGYPLEVSFSFDYGGRHYEKSFLTVLTMHLCNPLQCVVNWYPGRRGLSVPLPDKSLLIIQPEWPVWPFIWSRVQSGSALAIGARWLWMNDSQNPRVMVAADSASRLRPDRAGGAPFAWVDVRATLRRQEMSALVDAARADYDTDPVADRVVSSSIFGGKWPMPGRLFAGIDIAPLMPKGTPGEAALADLKRSDGWVSLTGGCRIKSTAPGTMPGMRPLPINFRKNRGLLEKGDTWIDAAGPHADEARIMFSAGAPKVGPKQSFFVPSIVSPVMEALRNIETGGKTCAGIHLPAGTVGAYLDLGSGPLMALSPLLGWAVVKD